MAQSLVKRGSVVLIRNPFTDLTGAKVRPPLVLTPDHLFPRLDNVLCLLISSAMLEDLLPTDYVLEHEHASFLHQVTVIGEAVKRLSQAFRGRHPILPWSFVHVL
jgi:mRNA-degrading endonuclease toxin of MazEF toxin-antitoxin module